MKYKQSDIITNGTHKRKILGICGEIYFVSAINDFKSLGASFTESDLDKHGYTLYEEPKVLELTLDEVAKKFNIPVDQLKIKK